MNGNTIEDVIDSPAKGSKAKAFDDKGPAKTSAPEAKSGATAKPFGHDVKRVLGRAAATPRTWMMITCGMLAISGGIRHWRGYQFYSLGEESRACPFPLADLPTAIGSWRMTEGSDVQLAPEISQIAGSTDHIQRSYTDERTGEVAAVLVMYGPAANVPLHSAITCYPAAGYTLAGEAGEYDLRIPGSGKVARYGGAIFSKKVAGYTEYAEVVYSFRHAGDWLPEASSRWKMFRYKPGCFKVQVARIVHEFAIESSPSVNLLQDIMVQIEKRLPQKVLSSEAPAPGLQGGPSKKAE
jgi:hypothetical protein